MTALTAPRITPSLATGKDVWTTHPCAANKKIYPGAQVGLNASGNLVPATSSPSLTVLGVASPKGHQLTRSGPAQIVLGYIDTTDLADAAVECTVQRCIALMKNEGSSITKADIGSSCYAVDDQSVAKADGSAAGTGQVSELTITPAPAGAVSVTFNGFAPTEAFASSNVLATDNTALRNAINTHPQLINAMASPAVVNAGKVIVTFKPASGATSFTDASAGGPSVAHSVTTPNVAPTAATRSRAGRIHDVETRGVWVEYDAA